MKTNPLVDKGFIPSGTPAATQQASLSVNDSGGVCKECLNEDFDSCVCPEPEN